MTPNRGEQLSLSWPSRLRRPAPCLPDVGTASHLPPGTPALLHSHPRPALSLARSLLSSSVPELGLVGVRQTHSALGPPPRPQRGTDAPSPLSFFLRVCARHVLLPVTGAVDPPSSRCGEPENIPEKSPEEQAATLPCVALLFGFSASGPCARAEAVWTFGAAGPDQAPGVGGLALLGVWRSRACLPGRPRPVPPGPHLRSRRGPSALGAEFGALFVPTSRMPTARLLTYTQVCSRLHSRGLGITGERAA